MRIARIFEVFLFRFVDMTDVIYELPDKFTLQASFDQQSQYLKCTREYFGVHLGTISYARHVIRWRRAMAQPVSSSASSSNALRFHIAMAGCP